MLSIDARGLDEARARLFARSTRVVGWGSGSVFHHFHTRFPVPLDYLVDNDASRWGTERRCIPIVPPETLMDEEPRDTMVIVYSSAWPEIQRQVATLCDVPAFPASAVFADASVHDLLARASSIAAQPRAGRSPGFDRTIVVQGPVWPGVTAHVLRVLTVLHPTNAVVLSTWDGTPREVLAEVAPLADDVVLTRKPDMAGIQNRNAQIVSTRAGIDRAIERGASTILKTRSDLVVMAPSLFEQAASWLDCVGRSAARRAGLRDRLIVPSSFTRKFLLYHPSDLVMLGAAEDMRQYWSAPLDGRGGDLLSPDWMDRSLSAVNMAGNPTESYLGLQFCRSLGRPALGTVMDSWAFYRDLFAVVDNDWFDLLWFKNLSIPDASVHRGPRQVIRQAFWHRLVAGDRTVAADVAEVDVDHTALRALAEAA